MKTKTLIRRLLAALGIGTALCVAVPAVSQNPAPGLASHQAIYRASLESATPSSGVADATGTVIYRFADACDGWTVENQVALQISTGDGGELDSLWAYTSWEAKDGRSFRFRMRDERNGLLIEELGGEAEMPADGPGVVHLTAPAETDVDLPAGTLFPMAHLQMLFEQARAGERYVTATVFDGADLDNPYRVGAAIGSTPADRQKQLTEQVGLAELPIWAMRMAFFPGTEGSAEPKFEVGVQYREDGIAAEIVQDFGDFTLKLIPERVELLPDPDC